jgi:putative molybdopterin biosynthesis protein
MSDRTIFRDLASPEAAHDAIASLDLGSGTEMVPIDDARGRVLAERIDATQDVPGFDRAAMDGYAVRAADTFGADEGNPVELDHGGTVHAGEAPAVEVHEGTAVEISTGAVMPPGADAVVMVEETSERDDVVEIRSAVTPGQHVMYAGTDVAAGERALSAGTHLTPREIGLLAALGDAEIPVKAAPTVGIISTGKELVRPGGTLDVSAGQIYDTNSYAIQSAVEMAGGEPKLYPHAGDDRDELERVLRRAADECDLVLSSGSTSAGAVDVLYKVLEDQGELLLHGVAIKPGKPMLVGRLDSESGPAAYVGLPGYPVSALTIFREFVAPALREATGRPEPASATVTGEMAIEERYSGGRRRLVPVGLVENGDGETLVYSVDRGSGATRSLVEADGIVAMDPDTDVIEAGTEVTVRLFSEDVRPPTLLGVGETDPALSRLLDEVANPRYLGVGSREGMRRLRDGVPDVAVTAGEHASDPDFDAVALGGWTREWGLVVAVDVAVAGLAALVDQDVQFANRGQDTSLRQSLDAALAELADDEDTSRATLAAEIDGYERTLPGLESPARAVADGTADAGLGLRATADALDLDFVALGSEPVTAFANPDRLGNAGVETLRELLDDDAGPWQALPGYDAA